MTIYTWAKAQAKNIESWMHGNGHVQIEQRGAGDNTPHRLYQTDAVTLTLLGKRDGDCFTRHTGVVVQSDCNAALAVLHRGTDKDITRYMGSSEVQAVLLRRTAMFLKLEGKSLEDAVELEWLDPKHRKNPEFQRLVGGSLPASRKKSGKPKS